MVLNCYESREVVAMVSKVPGPSDIFYNLAFPATNTIVTKADKVAISSMAKARVCAAPYTDPCGPGVSLKRPADTAEIGEFTPPTIKLHDVVVPCDAEEFRIDPATGEFVSNYEDRFAKAVADIGIKHRGSIRERLNLTAAQVLVNGAYTISGDDVATTLIDFRRDPRLTIDQTVSGGEPWNAPASRPMELVEAITGVMNEYGAGSGPFDILMSPAAWKWFSKHDDAERRAYGGIPRLANGTNTDPMVFQHVQFKGTYGSFRLWKVDQRACVDGVESPMIPDGGIIVLNAVAFSGKPVFGAIRKADGTQETNTIWFRDMYNEKCETRELQAWTRPLLVPGNVNASAYALVVDPAAPDAVICYDC